MSRKTHLLTVLGALVLGVMTLSSCFSPFSEAPSGSDPQSLSSGSGNLRFLFVLPRFRGWNYLHASGSKVIDPQTNEVHVVVLGATGAPVLDTSIPFSGGTQNDHGFFTTWETTASVPAGSYYPGTISVELKDSGGMTLAQGINLQQVDVLPGPTPAAATISCIPASPTPIAGVGSTPAIESGSVTGGHVEYFAFLAAYGGEYDLSTLRTGGNGEPDLYLFDPMGVPVQRADASGGSASITAYLAPSNGIFYIGVFGYDAGSGGDVDYDLSVGFTGTAQGYYPVINELFFNPNGSVHAIELFNPTDEELDVSGGIIEINLGYTIYQITPAAGTLIPALGYYVIFSGEPDYEEFNLLNMHYGVSAPTWWWWGGDSLSVKLIAPPPLSVEVDFIRINTEDDVDYPGDWSGAAFYIPGYWGSVARTTPLADTNSAADWEMSYGTLGLPNDFSGSGTILVQVY
jgi:hypothetical protein